MSAALPHPAVVPTRPSDLQPVANESRCWDDAVTSATFVQLLDTKRRLITPLLLSSFSFVIAITLLAGYGKGLLAVKVFGSFNVGYLLVLFTYVMCWSVAIIYVRAANARFDAQAAAAIGELAVRRPS
ncbi:MAG: DUF485 domain-containing protein [Methylibium sp.]|uniref:DUF485 domain-containing protein n=1 Tax=Methylibium sp. TaxID=2067992 RepID=UPI00182392B2|nr:DUF485 domain-containing protein [Methylibium sp.]MBA3595976.1 DUF485 domain-containing protein [Methylibium sp.]